MFGFVSKIWRFVKCIHKMIIFVSNSNELHLFKNNSNFLSLIRAYSWVYQLSKNSQGIVLLWSYWMLIMWKKDLKKQKYYKLDVNNFFNFETSNFHEILLNWKPPSLSELTPMVFNTGLTHLGSKTRNFTFLSQV